MDKKKAHINVESCLENVRILMSILSFSFLDYSQDDNFVKHLLTPNIKN